MIGIVDRIVGNIVVLEVEDEMVEIGKDKFPKEIQEGDLVKKKKNKFIILYEETENRKKRIDDLFNGLTKK